MANVLKTLYKEPAPIKDMDNPLESMMSRFSVAAEILGLDEEIYNVLKSPAAYLRIVPSMLKYKLVRLLAIS